MIIKALFSSFQSVTSIQNHLRQWECDVTGVTRGITGKQYYAGSTESLIWPAKPLYLMMCQEERNQLDFHVECAGMSVRKTVLILVKPNADSIEIFERQ